MKRTIRLTESELRGMIAESVKMVLRESTRPQRKNRRRINEGGHLYYKDEDGKVHTNSRETYRGVPGSVFIWHGTNADAEVLWNGVELNATDIEEGLWYSYEDECRENGETPSQNGFEEWLEQMGTEYIASQMDDLAWASQGNP